MPENLTDIINREFNQPKTIQQSDVIKRALERVDFIKAEIERTISRVTNRATKLEMFRAENDHVLDGINHLAQALHQVNLAWEDFESAAPVFGVSEDDIAEIVNALQADDVPTPQPQRPEDVPGFPFKGGY